MPDADCDPSDNGASHEEAQTERAGREESETFRPDSNTRQGRGIE